MFCREVSSSLGSKVLCKNSGAIVHSEGERTYVEFHCCHTRIDTSDDLLGDATK